jgi:hypothetical protein
MIMDHIAADNDFMKCNAPQACFYSKTLLTLLLKNERGKWGR